MKEVAMRRTQKAIGSSGKAICGEMQQQQERENREMQQQENR